MQYSILDGAIWTVNTTVGNTSVNYDTMYALIDYDDTPYLDLSSSAVFVMDFDFGQRVHLDRFEYKFISNDASDSAIASGIKFYFKDEPFDSYSLHNTSVSMYFCNISLNRFLSNLPTITIPFPFLLLTDDPNCFEKYLSKSLTSRPNFSAIG